jgi:DNA-binding HxlR family transcriptional regulator
VLTQQLKELEHDGIIRRQVYAEVPSRVEYSLSAFGQSLLPVLDALYDWGVRYYLQDQPAAAEAFLTSEAAPEQP